MRIRDWSSDVCSSDLAGSTRNNKPCRCTPRTRAPAGNAVSQCTRQRSPRTSIQDSPPATTASSSSPASISIAASPVTWWARRERNTSQTINASRSEEHTSELQSLMRISYAVFCLKKKNNTNNKQIQHINHTNEHLQIKHNTISYV